MLHLHALSDPAVVDAYLAELCRLYELAERHQPALGNRPLRAMLLVAGGGVRPHPSCPEARLVASSSRPGLYHLVRLDTGTCTCPDFASQARRQAGTHQPYCKHLIAAIMQDVATGAIERAAEAARAKAESRRGARNAAAA